MRISDWSSDVCSSDLYSSRSISRLAAAEFAPTSNCRSHTGSVAKIVKLEHAGRRLDGRNDDGFQVAPYPGCCDPVVGALVERQSGVEGQGVSVLLELGCGRLRQHISKHLRKYETEN